MWRGGVYRDEVWGKPAVIRASAIEPAIVIDNDGVAYILWRDDPEGDSNIVYTTSSNDGSSWSMPGRVNDDATAFLQRQLAVVAGNSVYAVWSDFRRANWDIEFAGLPHVRPVPLIAVAIDGSTATQLNTGVHPVQVAGLSRGGSVTVLQASRRDAQKPLPLGRR